MVEKNQLNIFSKKDISLIKIALQSEKNKSILRKALARLGRQQKRKRVG